MNLTRKAKNMDRRTLLRGASAMPIAFSLPNLALAQSGDVRPDFDILGTRQTNPPGYEIAWSQDWNEKDITNLTFEDVPGKLEYLVLDWANPPDNLDTQRIVIETHAASEVIDPEWLINSFDELHPGLEMGYAPGTRIETRKVTDLGCWFSFAGGESPFETGVVGLSLYYTPQTAGNPLLHIYFNVHSGTNRTPEHLEMIDSTISINGDWFLGMDELDAYWEAFEKSTESTL